MTKEFPKPRSSGVSGIRFAHSRNKILGFRSGTKYIVSMADYKGQKLSQITVSHPVRFFGPPGNRIINVIIFVVDLFPEWLSAEDNTRKPINDEELLQNYKQNASEKITERVVAHRQYITEYTIEQIFALSFNESKLYAVKLIVNKIDLLREIIDHGYLPDITLQSMTSYVEELYKPIIEEIQKACKANNISDFSVCLISAKTGENIQKVFGDIFEAYHKRQRLQT